MGHPSCLLAVLILLIALYPAGAEDLHAETVQVASNDSSLEPSDLMISVSTTNLFNGELDLGDDWQYDFEQMVPMTDPNLLSDPSFWTENRTSSREPISGHPNLDIILDQIQYRESSSYYMVPGGISSSNSFDMLSGLYPISSDPASGAAIIPYEDRVSGIWDQFLPDEQLPDLELSSLPDSRTALFPTDYSPTDLEDLSLNQGLNIFSDLDSIGERSGRTSVSYHTAYLSSDIQENLNRVPDLSFSQDISWNADSSLEPFTIPEMGLQAPERARTPDTPFEMRQLINEIPDSSGNWSQDDTAPAIDLSALSLMLESNLSSAWGSSDIIRDPYLISLFESHLPDALALDYSLVPATSGFSEARLSDIQSSNATNCAENFSILSDELHDPVNYAVVVGINHYQDRSSLYAPVNDAQELAEILESCNYRVIQLTDYTQEKPTKHNILNEALAEIKAAPNKGNVVVYFSGHGEISSDGRIYLIPQDADGAPSSYISEEELLQYIKDIPRLSLIIDACHSGGLGSMIGEGQLMLASSKLSEPSNENWLDDNSVFTHFLCQAIEEDIREKGEVQLQSCFYRAFNKTKDWAKGHFLTQTPVIVDGTDGSYLLD